jgi:hypothetical protein
MHTDAPHRGRPGTRRRAPILPPARTVLTVLWIGLEVVGFYMIVVGLVGLFTIELDENEVARLERVHAFLIIAGILVGVAAVLTAVLRPPWWQSALIGAPALSGLVARLTGDVVLWNLAYGAIWFFITAFMAILAGTAVVMGTFKNRTAN